MNKFALLSLTFALLPLITGAVAAPSDFKGLVDIFVGLIGYLVLLVFALTFLTIIWTIIKGWIIHPGDADATESGKKVVIVGVIALVVMSSIWGILALLRAGLFGG